MTEINPKNTFSLFIKNTASPSAVINLFGLGQSGESVASPQSLATSTLKFAPILNPDTITVNGNYNIQFNQANGNSVVVPITTGQNLSAAIETGFNNSSYALNNSAVLIITTPAGFATRRFFSIQQPQSNSNWVLVFRQTGLPSAAFITTNLAYEYFNGTAIQIRTQTSGLKYSDIRRSQIANAYRPLAINVYSENQDQVLNTMAVTHENANGNKEKFAYIPTIDPYGKLAYVKDSSTPLLILNGRTNMAYEIMANTSLRLDFMYIFNAPARLFDIAIEARLRDEYFELNKLINQSKGKLTTLILAD